ncbi:MAG: hypothetical protein WD294_07325 [Phycisphaeraceae bacterium]
MTAARHHSANVRLYLESRGQTVALAQVAPNWVIPVESCNLPAGEAEVVTNVDGREHRWRVFLTDGMSDPHVRTQVRPHLPVS